MSQIDRLLEIMAGLRDPETGCPWDREQTYASIVPHTIEEAYEVADSITREDYDELRDELGDLLLQVVFYSQIAREEGRFCFDDVVASINDKLIRRHPHVFGDAHFDSEEARSEAWELQKARERDQKTGQPSGRLEGIAQALPALTRAVKLQKRAARSGFDWEDVEPVFDKIQEELDELRHEIRENASHEHLEDEMGDILFAATNLSRHLGLDPEAALRSTNRKFERRFAYIESQLEAQDRVLEECNLDELEKLWQEAKSEV